MTPWIAWLIAVLCAAAFVALWFWEVRRTLTGRQSIVDSAASQVTAFRRRLAQTPADREAAAVLYRSESIYCQAVDNYNHALHRPWVYIPACIMGFRRAPEEPEPGPMDGGSHAE